MSHKPTCACLRAGFPEWANMAAPTGIEREKSQFSSVYVSEFTSSWYATDYARNATECRRGSSAYG